MTNDVYKLKPLTHFMSSEDVERLNTLVSNALVRIGASAYDPSYHVVETMENLKEITDPYVHGPKE